MQNSGMCWIFLQISGNIKSGSIHTLTSALGAGWLALGATLLCLVLRALMIERVVLRNWFVIFL
jgi:hypothetical protein